MQSATRKAAGISHTIKASVDFLKLLLKAFQYST